MPLFGRRPRPRRGNANAVSDAALTAAGVRIRGREGDDLRRLIQPWQARSFSYYDQLGEIKYASQFYARMLSPLRLYAAELDDHGDWVETTFAPAVEALERIQDPGGGREGLLGSYGRLMFLTGECYLLVTNDPDTGREQWEMLSTDELRIQAGVYVRYKAPSLAAENLREPSDDDWEPIGKVGQPGESASGDDVAVAYRLWKRHPRYSMLADATMMGVLDLCEELLLLTRAVRARARSRLAGSGILAVAEEFSYAPLEPEPDEDVESDPFLADLTASMTLPIQQEGAASAVVPLVLRGPGDLIKEGIRHIQIIDPTQLYPETGLRYELIKRIAIGLDMPPEILLGLSDANHWSAWQIDDQTWKGHGQPIATQLCNDLSSSYFRPQLRDDDVADWSRYAIAYDATAIINHPDRSKDAKDLYAARAIGKKALREAAGFDEEDAPTEAERAEMIGVAVRDGSLAWFGEPAPRGGTVETAPGVIVQAGEDDAAGAATGAEVEPGAPEEPPQTEDTPPGSVVGSAETATRLEAQLALARVAGAGDLALLRAREAAGNRLRSLAKRDPDLARLLEGVAARDVAWTLGRERARALGVASERELVAAASEILVETLRLWGVEGERAAALIADQIERHAARTLYDEHPSPLPPQFQGYVEGVLRPGGQG